MRFNQTDIITNLRNQINFYFHFWLCADYNRNFPSGNNTNNRTNNKQTQAQINRQNRSHN